MFPSSEMINFTENQVINNTVNYLEKVAIWCWILDMVMHV